MMKCDERRKVKVDAGCIDEIDPGYRLSERATNCFAFSTRARKDFTISLAMIKRIFTNRCFINPRRKFTIRRYPYWRYIISP